MKTGKAILAILLATIWISISEFVRNQYLLNTLWTDHYKKLGITFPAGPINGAVWGIWSLFLAVAVFIISRKFTFVQTTLLSWFLAFAMMWLVLGNLNVLPYNLLLSAIPLSLLEVFIAAYIIKKLSSD